MTTNDSLLQMQADLLGATVIRPAVTETTALGVAYLAGLAAGFWHDTAQIAAQWTADAVFAPKSPLYDGLEFNDQSMRRYLVRKLEDVAPHVAPLDEVKVDVVAAWKIDKARVLAEAAARDLAATVKKDGGRLKDEIVAGRPVLAIEAITKMNSGLTLPGRGQQFAPPTRSELIQIPNAGEPLREALFKLNPGDVEIARDAPERNVFVMTLDRRDHAGFNGLYGPAGMPTTYRNDAFRDAFIARETQRIETLRAKAGLKLDWVPSDEKDRELADNTP